MLDTMRKHSGSVVIYLVFLALIVVFAVNFGPGSAGCTERGGTTYAAKVDGDMIPQAQYFIRFNRQLEMFRRNAELSGMSLDDKMVERLGLREQVIGSLIDKKLLAHEAKRRGLTVSDQELLDHLKEHYGVEDVTPEQYENWVARSFQTTLARFEDETRDEILAQKLATVVTGNLAVSEAELKDTFWREHDRAMVSYVKFATDTETTVEPSAAAIDKLVKDEPKAIEARYHQDTFTFRVPKQVRARHILRRLPPSAADAEVAKARAFLLELKKKLDGGADFGALAKESSEDAATAQQGGDLGWIKRGEGDKAVDEAALNLKQGETTAEPVRSAAGLELIQAAEVTPAHRRELKEVERDLAATLLRERQAEARALEQANALLAKLKAGKPLAELTTTEEESKPATEPKSAPPPKPAKAKGKGKAKPAEVAQNKPLRIDSVWLLKSEVAIARIGVSKELHDAIFALTPAAPVAPQAHKVGSAYYVVVLKEREVPDDTKFEAQKTTLRDQALWAKRTRVVRDWVAYLKQHAHVVLNPSLFGKDGEAEPDAEQAS